MCRCVFVQFILCLYLIILFYVYYLFINFIRCNWPTYIPWRFVPSPFHCKMEILVGQHFTPPSPSAFASHQQDLWVFNFSGQDFFSSGWGLRESGGMGGNIAVQRVLKKSKCLPKEEDVGRIVATHNRYTGGKNRGRACRWPTNSSRRGLFKVPLGGPDMALCTPHNIPGILWGNIVLARRHHAHDCLHISIHAKGTHFTLSCMSIRKHWQIQPLWCNVLSLYTHKH